MSVHDVVRGAPTGGADRARVSDRLGAMRISLRCYPLAANGTYLRDGCRNG